MEIQASGPIPKFASARVTFRCELRNLRTTRQLYDPSAVLNLKFLNELVASNDRNLKFTALECSEGTRQIPRRFMVYGNRVFGTLPCSPVLVASPDPWLPAGGWGASPSETRKGGPNGGPPPTSDNASRRTSDQEMHEDGNADQARGSNAQRHQFKIQFATGRRHVESALPFSGGNVYSGAHRGLLFRANLLLCADKAREL